MASNFSYEQSASDVNFQRGESSNYVLGRNPSWGEPTSVHRSASVPDIFPQKDQGNRNRFSEYVPKFQQHFVAEELPSPYRHWQGSDPTANNEEQDQYPEQAGYALAGSESERSSSTYRNNEVLGQRMDRSSEESVYHMEGSGRTSLSTTNNANEFPMQPMGHPSDASVYYNEGEPYPQHGYACSPGLQGAPVSQVMRHDFDLPKPKEKFPETPAARRKILVERVVSILFILYDVVSDWLQEEDFRNGNSDELEGKHISCSASVSTIVYTILTGLGTVYALFQIANIINETIYELSAGKKSRRIFHGFNETAVSAILVNLPQIIIIALYPDKCSIEFDSKKPDIRKKIFKKIQSMMTGFFRDSSRFSTCKQKREVKCCGPCECTCTISFCCIFEVDLCGRKQCQPRTCCDGCCTGCDNPFKDCCNVSTDPTFSPILFKWSTILQVLALIFWIVRVIMLNVFKVSLLTIILRFLNL